MNNDHLTDHTIQAYAIQEIADSPIALHISACAACKAKLESYRVLMRSISNIEPETFSFDATALVMQKIRQSENRKTPIGDYTLNAISWLLNLGVLILGIPFIKPVYQLFHAFTGITNVLIAVSACSVLIFLLTDIFRQYRQREMLLSE